MLRPSARLITTAELELGAHVRAAIASCTPAPVPAWAESRQPHPARARSGVKQQPSE